MFVRVSDKVMAAFTSSFLEHLKKLQVCGVPLTVILGGLWEDREVSGKTECYFNFVISLYYLGPVWWEHVTL